MSSLILKDKKKTIGVVRNPYERAVTEYFYAFNYIGFDKWCLKFPLEAQTKLYKDCDYIVNFSAWEDELKELNLHPKDTSVLEDVKIVTDWKRWYTIKSKTNIAVLYKDDIMTYGHRF